MKTKFLLLPLVASFFLSCSLVPEIDTSELFSDEPEIALSLEESKTLLDNAAGHSFSNRENPIVINMTEEETFSVEKADESYYLFGDVSQERFQISFTSGGYFIVELEEGEKTFLTINADSSALILIQDGIKYKYGRE